MSWVGMIWRAPLPFGGVCDKGVDDITIDVALREGLEHLWKQVFVLKRTPPDATVTITLYPVEELEEI